MPGNVAAAVLSHFYVKFTHFHSITKPKIYMKTFADAL